MARMASVGRRGLMLGSGRLHGLYGFSGAARFQREKETASLDSGSSIPNRTFRDFTIIAKSQNGQFF